MKVLVACEFSGIVRDAFIKRGHDAVSCDLLPTETPGPHIQGDVLEVLKDGWDMMLAFPPCTHLSVSGAMHFHKKEKEQRGAIEFFLKLLSANIQKICVENPVGVFSTRMNKPSQIIQPWQFGHEAQKTTCLWLRWLPLLVPTKIVGRGEFVTFPSGKRMARWYAELSGKGKERSKFWPGIAEAMADQWG